MERAGPMMRRILTRIVPQSAKAGIKRLLDVETFSMSALAARLVPSLFGATHRRNTFQTIYQQKMWGGKNEIGFFSGIGSRGKIVTEYVDHIARLIRERSSFEVPTRIIDLGCGDFSVGGILTERISDIQYRYIGCDIVPELVAHNNRTFSNGRIFFRETRYRER